MVRFLLLSGVLFLLIVLLFKNTALSIIIYIAIFIFEALVRLIFRIFHLQEAIHYFPMKVIANLTPRPKLTVALSEEVQNQVMMNMQLDSPITFTTSIILAFVYTAIFVGLSFLVIRKKSFN